MAKLIQKHIKNFSHYAIVVTKISTKTQTKINNTAVSSGWTNNNGYSYYTKQFNSVSDLDKTFKIENPSVPVLCYGISRVESYYYNAARGLCDKLNFFKKLD
ncbi:MAG: hypothetical protein LBS50_00195 [Prevotellaceae bacterium]|nr:hypothetical protein [Prevotellaceae bacterium]